MKKLIISIFTATALMACTPGAQTLNQEGIVISAPMVRLPMGGQNMTAGYFKVTNHTNIDDALTSVESPNAGRIEIHVTEDNNGVMRMRRQDVVNIKAGETLSFEPGGLHLMLFDIKLAADQNDIPLNLKFKNSPDLPIMAELVETTPLPGDHSGHH